MLSCGKKIGKYSWYILLRLAASAVGVELAGGVVAAFVLFAGFSFCGGGRSLPEWTGPAVEIASLAG